MGERMSDIQPNFPWSLQHAQEVKAKALTAMNKRVTIVGQGSTDGDSWFQRYQAMFNAASCLENEISQPGTHGFGQ